MSRVAAEVGSTANSYQILAKLATGGMAEIFLARGEGVAGVERHCVLKRILRDRASDVHFVRMFLDEARLAAQLQHPNIAQVYDIGKLGDSYFFTMEYVHGETVRSLLHRAQALRRQLPIGGILTIAAGTAAGLHHAHTRLGFDGRPLGIVHRDVSPSNLMVSYEGSVKVVDFGVAKAEDRGHETKSGTVKGKISYLSPEQCKGKRVDRRSDLFSLGICLWEMLTTDRLYRRSSDFENMHAIVHEVTAATSSRRADVPREVDELVLRLLAKTPEERPQTAEEVVEAIESIAARTGSLLSPSALGKLMRELFGQRPEPWLELENQHEPGEAITVTSEPIPPELAAAPVDKVNQQLASVVDLSRHRIVTESIDSLGSSAVVGPISASGAPDPPGVPRAAGAPSAPPSSGSSGSSGSSESFPADMPTALGKRVPLGFPLAAPPPTHPGTHPTERSYTAALTESLDSELLLAAEPMISAPNPPAGRAPVSAVQASRSPALPVIPAPAAWQASPAAPDPTAFAAQAAALASSSLRAPPPGDPPAPARFGASPALQASFAAAHPDALSASRLPAPPPEDPPALPPAPFAAHAGPQASFPSAAAGAFASSSLQAPPSSGSPAPSGTAAGPQASFTAAHTGAVAAASLRSAPSDDPLVPAPSGAPPDQQPSAVVRRVGALEALGHRGAPPARLPLSGSQPGQTGTASGPQAPSATALPASPEHLPRITGSGVSVSPADSQGSLRGSVSYRTPPERRGWPFYAVIAGAALVGSIAMMLVMRSDPTPTSAASATSALGPEVRHADTSGAPPATSSISVVPIEPAANPASAAANEAAKPIVDERGAEPADRASAAPKPSRATRPAAPPRTAAPAATGSGQPPRHERDDEITTAYAAEHYEKVVEQCSSGPVSAEHAPLCFLAACHTGNEAKASKLIAAVPASRREQLITNCRQLGLEIKKPEKPAVDCDADPMACQH